MVITMAKLRLGQIVCLSVRKLDLVSLQFSLILNFVFAFKSGQVPGLVWAWFQQNLEIVGQAK